MRIPKSILPIAIIMLLATGCKDIISPHVKPEIDADLAVARIASETGAALKAREDAAHHIVLTLNNAPEANEPLEQDFITQLVELFEKRNPDIQIQFSPWQYTPESFFERVKNRTLTDIVEIQAEQMTAIIEANCAADLTDEVARSPEIRLMNPQVFTVMSKENRVYGVPTELHTMALFFNRRLLEATKTPPIPPKDAKPADTNDKKKKGKGSDGGPFELTVADLPKPEPIVVAQYRQQQPYYYPPGYQQQQQRQQNRGEQEIQNYYNVQPQQYRGGYQQQYRGYYQQQPQQQRRYQQQPQSGPTLYAPPDEEEDARQRRMRNRRKNGDEFDDIESTSTRRKKKSKSSDEETGDENSTTTESGDTLTSAGELALQNQETSESDSITTVVKTENLPADWDQFIRLAVRLTDHEKHIYGFAPVLYSREGGREFSQWAVESGLEIEKISGHNVSLDVNSKGAGEVAQFIKDLHWRFDVMPPPDKCFYDNLMHMFAEGKLGMMILPADGNTLALLTKYGMPLDDIGVSVLPKGPANRDHLTFGKALIINTQIDKEKRAAAFKWVTFMASAEVKRLRARFFYREGEQTGVPEVPLYMESMQNETYEAIKQFRSLPRFADYTDSIAPYLKLEPPFKTDRLYESIAEGVRPIIEREDSDPYQAVTTIASEFEKNYLAPKTPDNMLEYYVDSFFQKAAP